MDTEIRNPVLRFVVYGHVVLAVGAAAQVWWVDELLSLHVSPRLIAFAALITFVAYGAMRLLRMNVPDLVGSGVMIWYRLNARLMIALVALCAVGAVAIGWPMRWAIVHALWLPGLVAAAYTLPLSFAGGRPIGLRRIPLLKAFIIAYVWASAVVLLPGMIQLDGDTYLRSDMYWVAAIWCAFFVAIAIAFDVRDLPYDHPSLRTLPQVFGARGAKVIAILMLLPLLWMLVVMVVIGYYPIESGWREPQVEWAHALPAIGLVAVAVLIARADHGRPWWYWSLLLDGSLILLPLLSWIGSLL